jgi:hypothetical protein
VQVKVKSLTFYSYCLVGAVCIALVFMFVDDYIAPLFLNSRIERLHETGLPKARLEKGCVYCRMKADDFRLPLPPGYRAMAPIITSGGFDWVDGSAELRFDSNNPVGSRELVGWQPDNLQVGASVTVDQVPGGMLIKFHYFGDR